MRVNSATYRAKQQPKLPDTLVADLDEVHELVAACRGLLYDEIPLIVADLNDPTGELAEAHDNLDAWLTDAQARLWTLLTAATGRDYP